MTQTQELLELDSHFSFGENWSHYSEKIDEARIEEAEKSLIRLVGREAIEGKTFLDIGCGSGLFSLAAVRLGAKKLLAVDLDPKSVDTTRKTLSRYAAGKNWDVQNISVFNLDPEKLGVFDVVYSWGVLHHTGAMYQAITKATTMVAPGGMISLALYGKTPFCGMWRIEKRIYTQLAKVDSKDYRGGLSHGRARASGAQGRKLQKAPRKILEAARHGHVLRHARLARRISLRIDFAGRSEDFMRGLGFDQLRSFVEPCIGLLGAGCDEYSFMRAAARVSSI